MAQERARAAGGRLVLRNDDLDAARCRPEFVAASLEDLRWLGFQWDEGPDIGGPYGPYEQSLRMNLYREKLGKLIRAGFAYPCTCSRQDVIRAVGAPHAGEEEPVYPGTCRGKTAEQVTPGVRFNWRFRAPDGRAIEFRDGRMGLCSYTAGRDFGDFVLWRHDDVPSYQLACVVDDAMMRMTEVVRGEDLLPSTARQLLLYEALGWTPPAFFHCPLMRDENGARLAKRHDSLSLRQMRAGGAVPEEIVRAWS